MINLQGAQDGDLVAALPHLHVLAVSQLRVVITSVGSACNRDTVEFISETFSLDLINNGVCSSD